MYIAHVHTHTHTMRTERMNVHLFIALQGLFQWRWYTVSMLINFMNGKTNYEKYHNLYLTQKRTQLCIHESCLDELAANALHQMRLRHETATKCSHLLQLMHTRFRTG